MKIATRLAVMVVVLACIPRVRAEVVIETVTVGNPGNAGDTQHPSGRSAGFGGLDYEYRIGTFEVTAGQYMEFLNAVAETDTYGLYRPVMEGGCKITQHGSSGSYWYDFSAGTDEALGLTAADWENRPVNDVSWGDAARFANWLHNGQPAGAQDVNSTEDGSYDLTATHVYYGPGGVILDYFALRGALIAVVRKPDATWVIPSEDEWYKAAYHYNDGVTGNYYDCATSSDTFPSNDLIDPDPGNNATWHNGDWTIGSPYMRTEVGAHENSGSPYGTFDQVGNLHEYNEAVIAGIFRGLRLGSFLSSNPTNMIAAAHDIGVADPTAKGGTAGFRVARVQPTIPAVSEWGLVAMMLLVLSAGSIVLARRRGVVVGC